METVRHFFDGLNGVRCRSDGKDLKIGLSWDTITCLSCRALKRPEEADAQLIDTKGD